MSKFFYSLIGTIAVLIWSSNSYVFRQMTNNFGTFFGTGLAYVAGGIIGLIAYVCEHMELRDKTITLTPLIMTPLNKTTTMMYSLFITNMLFSAMTFSLPPTGDVLLQSIIINFFWTVLTNIFLVTLLNYKIKSKAGFYFGVLAAIAGIVIACIGFDFSRINFITYFPQYYYCYVFAIISALTWSYYSIYLNKYGHFIKNDHGPISIFITGIICIIISVIISVCNPSFNNYNNIQFTFKDIGCFLYESIVTFYLSYCCWNIGYKKGNPQILANFSLLAPVLSIIFTSLFYGLNLLGNVVYGSIILVIAIIFCKYSIVAPPEIGPEFEENNKLEVV